MNRLRALAGRPIGEGERRGAFRVGVAVLIAVTALLLLIPDGGLPPISPLPAAPAAQHHSLKWPLRPAPVSGPVAAARRFLAGFLPFLYGQGSSAAIRSVAPELADRLASSRQRVPPAALSRHPRATQLEDRWLGPGRASVAAQIEDGGVASYPISLTLARRGGRWLVIAEGMD